MYSQRYGWLCVCILLLSLFASEACSPVKQRIQDEIIVLPKDDAGQHFPDQPLFGEVKRHDKTSNPDTSDKAPEDIDNKTTEQMTHVDIPHSTEKNEPTREFVVETLPEPSKPPYVQIVSPQAGSSVNNPVEFSIQARNVGFVELFSGTYSLGARWDPRQRLKHTYTFRNTLTHHTIHLKGYDATGQVVAQSTARIFVKPKPNTGKGSLLGKMYITYYYLSLESRYTGPADTTLYDKNCRPLVRVPAKFSDSACIEGSGRLKDGRIINYAKTCSCGRRCPTGGTICYSILDKKKYPWGQGARSLPLRPLRSLAVDRRLIPIGTKIYIQEWDGVRIPALDGIQSFVHDGCFSADDVGGAIKGKHFDFFAGTPNMCKALEKIHRTKKYLTVYKNPPRCP